jgi:SAM-dependent methyltransferase
MAVPDLCLACGKAVPEPGSTLCQSCSSNEVNWEWSRRRWKKGPQHHWEELTWGRRPGGEQFISKAAEYVEFAPEKRVLEIGPGYGRLLKACLDMRVPFAHFHGLDISEAVCSYLRERFPNENVTFSHGDVEEIAFDEGFDIVLSSLTFKHLFPSVENALVNLARAMNPGAVLCFDLIEGELRSFGHVREFVRGYTRPEVVEILERTGLEHVAFDEVAHDPDPEYLRLLVVARKGQSR